MMLITYDKEHMNQKLIKSRIHSSNFHAASIKYEKQNYANNL